MVWCHYRMFCMPDTELKIWRTRNWSLFRFLSRTASLTGFSVLYEIRDLRWFPQVPPALASYAFNTNNHAWKTLAGGRDGSGSDVNAVDRQLWQWHWSMCQNARESVVCGDNAGRETEWDLWGSNKTR